MVPVYKKRVEADLILLNSLSGFSVVFSHNRFLKLPVWKCGLKIQIHPLNIKNSKIMKYFQMKARLLYEEMWPIRATSPLTFHKLSHWFVKPSDFAVT